MGIGVWTILIGEFSGKSSNWNFKQNAKKISTIKRPFSPDLQIWGILEIKSLKALIMSVNQLQLDDTIMSY